jgi:hypothetical protein
MSRSLGMKFRGMLNPHDKLLESPVTKPDTSLKHSNARAHTTLEICGLANVHIFDEMIAILSSPAACNACFFGRYLYYPGGTILPSQFHFGFSAWVL